jgi:hypothetical protein
VQRNSPTDVLLIDLNAGDALEVRTDQSTRMSLAMWANLLTRPIAGQDLKSVGRNELQIGDEKVVCIEQDLDTGKLHLFPVPCRSERGLEVHFLPYVFTGRDHNEHFYSMLRQAQKF